MINLYKCPCCGHGAELLTHKFYGSPNTYGVHCVACSLQTYQFYRTPEEAANAWNMRDKPPEINVYDKEEVYPNCTVQVLTNTVTGAVSIGWRRNE